ncbi:protein-cysteine N-palmitoyltransferase HHAT-like [Amphiura filiformis]|uniref:protein-cysteine N-palmitoyltransferase HHAT-like n=1 Tax=Amphiura filiformis TaxID=82378 RepID=UPI003B21D430
MALDIQEYYQEPKPLSKEELKKILKEFLRYAFWWVFIDAALHFLYFPAFQQRRHLLMFLPSWAIGGIALNQLIFFQVKYVVLYGLPRAIGLFDRVDVPLPPICVLGTYMFQDFWRYFDRGLHRLLVQCIYIPLGGSRRGLLMQLLSSLVCFWFVYYWHGSDTHLLYWSWFNWVGVTLEQLIQLTIAKHGMETYCKRKLSGAMYVCVL